MELNEKQLNDMFKEIITSTNTYSQRGIGRILLYKLGKYRQNNSQTRTLYQLEYVLKHGRDDLFCFTSKKYSGYYSSRDSALKVQTNFLNNSEERKKTYPNNAIWIESVSIQEKPLTLNSELWDTFMEKNVDLELKWYSPKEKIIK
jgi:hypothetical protein